MSLAGKKITYRLHAAQRMFEREIAREQVLNVLVGGEVIEDYPQDTPYPSKLLLGVVIGRPLHVVVAINQEQNEAIVITAYWPSEDLWFPGFRSRKK